MGRRRVTFEDARNVAAVTVCFIAAVFVTVVVFDIVIGFTFGVQYTISDVIRGWGAGNRWAALAIMTFFNVLMWHFFVQRGP